MGWRGSTPSAAGIRKLQEQSRARFRTLLWVGWRCGCEFRLVDVQGMAARTDAHDDDAPRCCAKFVPERGSMLPPCCKSDSKWSVCASGRGEAVKTLSLQGLRVASPEAFSQRPVTTSDQGSRSTTTTDALYTHTLPAPASALHPPLATRLVAAAPLATESVRFFRHQRTERNKTRPPHPPRNTLELE